MLSREVATSMRGRAVETVITPYSFREFLRARQNEPKKGKRIFSAAERSKLESEFDAYLRIGGFPEAIAAESTRERVELLQSYVDVVLLRDVGERHRVGNLHALRAFVRHLLRRPSSLLSVNKIFNAFRSQGIAVSKGSLFEFFSYLEDAFLVFSVPLATDSERRRQSNPKKLYLSDSKTRERELRALTEAAREYPNALLLLLYESGLSKSHSIPEGIRIEPLWRWLLE